MITKYKPYYEEDQVMMTFKQKKALTELIYDRFSDEDTREQYLNQINDDLSYCEAQDMILELSI